MKIVLAKRRFAEFSAKQTLQESRVDTEKTLDCVSKKRYVFVRTPVRARSYNCKTVRKKKKKQRNTRVCFCFVGIPRFIVDKKLPRTTDTHNIPGAVHNNVL